MGIGEAATTVHELERGVVKALQSCVACLEFVALDAQAVRPGRPENSIGLVEPLQPRARALLNLERRALPHGTCFEAVVRAQVHLLPEEPRLAVKAEAAAGISVARSASQLGVFPLPLLVTRATLAPFDPALRTAD